MDETARDGERKKLVWSSMRSSYFLDVFFRRRERGSMQQELSRKGFCLAVAVHFLMLLTCRD